MKTKSYISKYFKVAYEDGQPCKHPGCLKHMTHPCEGCGRIAGQGKVVEMRPIFREYLKSSGSSDEEVKLPPSTDPPYPKGKYVESIFGL